MSNMIFKARKFRKILEFLSNRVVRDLFPFYRYLPGFCSLELNYSAEIRGRQEIIILLLIYSQTATSQNQLPSSKIFIRMSVINLTLFRLPRCASTWPLSGPCARNEHWCPQFRNSSPIYLHPTISNSFLSHLPILSYFSKVLEWGAKHNQDSVLFIVLRDS